ncbi:MAG: threonine/serine exporter ThrE family protein [Gammaproteobacteria bacterium]
MHITNTPIPDGIKHRDAFVLSLMQALHLFGTPSHRLEQAMAGIARDLDMQLQILATPTSVTAAIGPLENQRTYLLRVEPSEANLEKLGDLQSIMQQVSRGTISHLDARDRIDEIVARAPRYRSIVKVMAYAIVGACVAVLFNGNLLDALVSSLLGGFIGVFTVLAAERQRLEMLIPTLSAAVAAMGARFVAELLPDTHPIIVTIAALIVLVPGLSLTMGVNELAHRHLVSGTARMMGALVVLLQLALGAAGGWAIVDFYFDPFVATVSAAPPWWWVCLAIVAVAAAFTVLFQARVQDYWVVLLGGSLAFLASRFGTEMFGPEFGAALGAWSMGCIANILARLRDKPALTTILPGIILLVPGAMGFKSIQAMLHNEVVMGLEAAMTMFTVSIALVIGLFLSNLTISPRKIL